MKVSIHEYQEWHSWEHNRNICDDRLMACTRSDVYKLKRTQNCKKRSLEKELPFIGGVTRLIRSSKSVVEWNPPCNRALTIFFCRVRQLLSSPYSLRIRPTSESGQEFNMSSALRLACHRPVHQFNSKEKVCITHQQAVNWV